MTPAVGIETAQIVGVGERDRHAARAQAPDRGLAQVRLALGELREALGRAVHRVDVVVAIVEEVAHLLPGGGLELGPLAPERLVERGEPLVGLAVGAVQFQEGAREGRGVGGGEPQIGQRREFRQTPDRPAPRACR